MPLSLSQSIECTKREIVNGLLLDAFWRYRFNTPCQFYKHASIAHLLEMKRGPAPDGTCPLFIACGRRTVSRILFRPSSQKNGGSHFSGTCIAAGLKRPTRGPRPSRP